MRGTRLINSAISGEYDSARKSENISARCPAYTAPERPPKDRRGRFLLGQRKSRRREPAASLEIISEPCLRHHAAFEGRREPGEQRENEILVNPPRIPRRRLFEIDHPSDDAGERGRGRLE
jgi:hypothetical protein